MRLQAWLLDLIDQQSPFILAKFVILITSTSSDRKASCAGQEAGWQALLDAGINDWGGMSPLTKDYVNPEKPWPHLHALAAATAATGKALLPR